MRLGDVLTETDESDEAPPKPKRRFGLWIALWLLLGLGALSWAHGPVVLFPEPDEAIVLYSPEGWGIFGPAVRTVVDKPFVVRLPLLQRFARMHTGPRTVEVDARLGTGAVSIRLAGGKIRHRVRPPDVSRVVLKLGSDPAVRDGLMRDLTRAVWAEAIADLDLADLADPARITARLEKAAGTLADRAATYGIDAAVEARPAVEVDPEVAGLLARIGEVEAQVRARRTGAGAEATRSADDRAALERRHRAELAATRAALQARLVEASSTAARARVRAERAYQARLSAAEVEKHTLMALAITIDSEAVAEAHSARVRARALGENGPRILDHVIATHVMPQLQRIRTGAVGDPRLPVMPLPPAPPRAEAQPADGDAAPQATPPAEPESADAPAPEEVRP